ncbi:MAG: MFS transporter, partial [Candidatus Avelusimicrobium sp.]|uniref:MFS transporter n=1 Tax=Candidatus Avelusimicrobium sp. TaxID=3048833 RepID=UPI003F090CD9
IANVPANLAAVLYNKTEGGVQALSRSHFAKIIPPEKSGEYFGLLDICGKGASMLGTFTVSLVSQLSGSTSLRGVRPTIFLIVGNLSVQKFAAKKQRTNHKYKNTKS